MEKEQGRGYGCTAMFEYSIKPNRLSLTGRG